MKVARVIRLLKTGALELRSPHLGNLIPHTDFLILVRTGMLDLDDEVDVEVTGLVGHGPREAHVAVPSGLDIDAVTEVAEELGLTWPIEITWDDTLRRDGRYTKHAGENVHRIRLHPGPSTGRRNFALLHELTHAVQAEAFQDFRLYGIHDLGDIEVHADATADQFIERGVRLVRL